MFFIFYRGQYYFLYAKIIHMNNGQVSIPIYTKTNDETLGTLNEMSNYIDSIFKF